MQMRSNSWEPTYLKILDDFGYDRSSDESTARLMKALLMNSDVCDDDHLTNIIGKNVIVAGGAMFDPEDIPNADTLIATGASIPRLLSKNIVPDIIVTDLDGDVEAQKEASLKGSLTIMHAHGDNADLVIQHAKGFKGKIIMTTQSSPDLIVYNFGGFTDGDRAVCMARHFGAERIYLIGFDLDDPDVTETKRKKLKWARSIIFDGSDDLIVLK